MLIIGDSLTDSGTVIDTVAAAAHIDSVGNRPSGGGEFHCGISGWSCQDHLAAAPLSPGGVLDVNAYFVAYGAPTHVVISFGPNDVLVEGDIPAETAAIETLLQAVKVARPFVRVIVTGPPNMPAFGQWANERAAWAAAFGGRTSDRIYWHPYAPVEMSADNIHPTTAGYQAMGAQLIAAINTLDASP